MVIHGKPDLMLAECGLDAIGIEKSVYERLHQLQQNRHFNPTVETTDVS